MYLKSITCVVAVCFLSIAKPATAIDGAYQINAACAAVGCFAGDSAGYPVTIAQPGTYELVGDLSVGNQVSSAIEVQASNVSIEMNGFRIIGPVTCSGTPVVCTPATVGGGNIGINGWAYNPTNLVVRNGSVTGMGTGILASYDGRVEHVQALQNGDAGVRARTGTAVVDSTGSYNGHLGIEGRLLVRCVASHNGQYGLAGGGLIKDSMAVFNDSYGIYLGTGTNVVSSTITNNSVGLFSSGSNQILDSLVSNNTLVGLQVTQGADSVSRSTFAGNNGGGQQWGGNVIETGINVCGTSTSCP